MFCEKYKQKVFENHCPLGPYLVQNNPREITLETVDELTRGFEQTGWALHWASCLAPVHLWVLPALQPCLDCQHRRFCLFPAYQVGTSGTCQDTLVPKGRVIPGLAAPEYWNNVQVGFGAKTYSAWDALPHPNSTHFVRLINLFVKQLVCTYYVQALFFDDHLLL